MKKSISVTLTHYRRVDLLRETVKSFLKTNTYPIDEFFIIDDSADIEIADIIKSEFSDIATIIVNEKNMGQRKSIEKLFNRCTGEYIFHLEEDWLFDCDPSEYVRQSLVILERIPHIHQVHVRHQYDDPHPTVGNVIYIDNIGFRYLDSDFRGTWNGFSFNPGLRRKSDIMSMFPDGISSFPDEKALSLHTRRFNYKAVRLENTVCRHIGWGRSTQTNGRGF